MSFLLQFELVNVGSVMPYPFTRLVSKRLHSKQPTGPSAQRSALAKRVLGDTPCPAFCLQFIVTEQTCRPQVNRAEIKKRAPRDKA